MHPKERRHSRESTKIKIRFVARNWECVMGKHAKELEFESNNCRSQVARCLFFSQEQTDTILIVNELCQEMLNPNQQKSAGGHGKQGSNRLNSRSGSNSGSSSTQARRPTKRRNVAWNGRRRWQRSASWQRHGQGITVVDGFASVRFRTCDGHRGGPWRWCAVHISHLRWLCIAPLLFFCLDLAERDLTKYLIENLTE